MSKWAAIIYGRTYEVDFRLIVRPEDFGTDEINWAKSHILGTIRSPEKLRDHLRWSLFKNERHCIVGLSCKAAALSEDMIQDRVGRPLFVFVGYVAQQPFPPIPPMNFELFKSPYNEYVGRRWHEKSHKTRKADRLSKSEYQELYYSYPVDDPGGDFNSSNCLNTSSDKICLWRDSDEYREHLWLAASRHERPISLCLGLAGQRDAVEGPFLNATALDVSDRIEIPKATIPSPPPQESEAPQEQKQSERKLEDVGFSTENLTPNEQNCNKVCEAVSQIVTAIVTPIVTPLDKGRIDNGIKKLGSLVGLNHNREKQDHEQQSSQSKEISQSKNHKKQSSVPDPPSNQQDIYSKFFKPKNKQDTPEIDKSQEDKSGWP